MKNKEVNIEGRISYLAEMFDVFDVAELETKLESYKELGFKDVLEIHNPYNDELIAIISFKNKKGHATKKISKISVEVKLLSMMIASDPTVNKIYLQWMLIVFTSLLKRFDTKEAISFACEDLIRAKDYLILFDANKRKDKFTRLCKDNFTLKHILDYSNINQYETLSQLFDAVDPFIVRDSTGVLSLIHRFVDLGHAEVPFRDKNFTVYIPKTIDASIIFHDFTSWCTSRIGNSNFNTYVNDKRPDGSKSKLFIIIPNEFFDGATLDLYQFHIETGQFRDRSNTSFDVEALFSKSFKLKNYFGEYLTSMVVMNRMNLKSDYTKWMFTFGFGYKLLEMMPDNIANIKFIDKNLALIPNVSKFKSLTTLVLVNCQISQIDDSIGLLENLTILSLPDNQLKAIPESICKLKKLKMLILPKNQITKIPDEISNLDPQNGGSLLTLIISAEHISAKTFKRLSTLLPNVRIEDPNMKKYEKI